MKLSISKEAITINLWLIFQPSQAQKITYQIMPNTLNYSQLHTKHDTLTTLRFCWHLSIHLADGAQSKSRQSTDTHDTVQSAGRVMLRWWARSGEEAWWGHMYRWGCRCPSDSCYHTNAQGCDRFSPSVVKAQNPPDFSGLVKTGTNAGPS